MRPIYIYQPRSKSCVVAHASTEASGTGIRIGALRGSTHTRSPSQDGGGYPTRYPPQDWPCPEPFRNGPTSNTHRVTGGLLKSSRVLRSELFNLTDLGPTPVFATGFPALSSDRERGLTAGWYQVVHTCVVRVGDPRPPVQACRHVHPDTGPLQFPFPVTPLSRATWRYNPERGATTKR